MVQAMGNRLGKSLLDPNAHNVVSAWLPVCHLRNLSKILGGSAVGVQGAMQDTSILSSSGVIFKGWKRWRMELKVPPYIGLPNLLECLSFEIKASTLMISDH
ncbi:unnamed protein product [Calypogeia fissa]